MKKTLMVFVIVAVLASGWFVFRQHSGSDDKSTPASSQKPAAFNKKQYSLTDKTSLWLIVNKQRPLQPLTYVPTDLTVPAVPLRLAKTKPEVQLRAPAARALEELVNGAKQDGIQLMLSSAYRSYAYQTSLYNHYVSTQGKAVADTQSARPGHSEHQTGLAVDVEPVSRKCEVTACFAELPEGKWVAEHAHEYGFVVRYLKGKDAITGYTYEPWHLRFVGRELAAELHKQGMPTLEDFFDLGAAPDYD